MEQRVKVGDRVRLVGSAWRKEYDEFEDKAVNGEVIVTVDEIDPVGNPWAGWAGSVGNSDGLFSADNPEGSGDYSVELVEDPEPGSYHPVTVTAPGGIDLTAALRESLKKLASSETTLDQSSEIGMIADSLGIARRDSFGSTPENPDHYKFPGGAEVIHISQWLTANAAQALQYIARSSRIDGKNKGDALEDIEKAIRFLNFERERLSRGSE